MKLSKFINNRDMRDDLTAGFVLVVGLTFGAIFMFVFGEGGAKHEDALRTFLTVLAAMVGIFGGFVSARLSDSITDGRKIRRKLAVACLQIKSLRDAWKEYLDYVKKLMERETRSVEEALAAWENDPKNDLHNALNEIRGAAASGFSLDEIVEDDRGMRHGEHVLFCIRFSLRIEADVPDCKAEAQLAKFLHSDTIKEVAVIVGMLDNALTHFKARMVVP